MLKSIYNTQLINPIIVGRGGGRFRKIGTFNAKIEIFDIFIQSLGPPRHSCIFFVHKETSKCGFMGRGWKMPQPYSIVVDSSEGLQE